MLSSPKFRAFLTFITTLWGSITTLWGSITTLWGSELQHFGGQLQHILTYNVVYVKMQQIVFKLCCISPYNSKKGTMYERISSRK